MNKLVMTAIACAIGATACSHVREPSDAQLATLLRSERAAATDPDAQLDTNAIECLRGWSGDADLLKGLAVTFAGEDGKKTCRAALNVWIGDAARNPDKLAFEDVSAPKAVRQAIALAAARTAAAVAKQSQHQIPGALTAPVVAAPRAPDPAVDLGIPGSELAEAETLCQQVQQAAAAPDANPKLASYANFCATNLSQLRATMEQAGRNGQQADKLTALAAGATNMAMTARKLLALGKQASHP